MKQILTFVVAVLFIATASTATAASPQDVQKVIQLLNHKSAKLYRFWNTDENGSFIAVYGANGNSYSAKYYSGFYTTYHKNGSSQVIKDKNHSPSLVFTKWPKKTVRKRQDFGDSNLDGSVDHGEDGYTDTYGYPAGHRLYTGYYGKRKLFSIEDQVGLQNQAYWQKIYDAAIIETLNHFK